MFRSWKRTWAAIREGVPGRRFEDHYRRRRERRGNGALRAVSLLGGLALLLVGIVLLFVPGPGILLILLGSALLAQESRVMAEALDRLEPWLGVLTRRVRLLWKRASRPARALAVALSLALAGAMAWVTLRAWLPL